MRIARAWCSGLVSFAAAAAVACGPDDSGFPDGGGPSANDAGLDGADGQAAQPTDKVDLLFMVSNNAAMGGYTASLLEASVTSMVQRLVNPNCIDVSGAVIGASQNGTCAAGKLEFQPVVDMHIGILSSSLGGRGGDQCDPSANSPVKGPGGETLNAHNDDRGELVNRGGAAETPVADAQGGNFLAWLPDVPQNKGKPAPPVKPIGDAAQLANDLRQMIDGIHPHGCGFNAQLESWYRFLVQPDPYDQIAKSGQPPNITASLQGVDANVLKQRHDFLRPDSAVAVVVLTDKNERAIDPLAWGGKGWGFANTSFPGSANSAAPEGTVTCATSPEDPGCVSCFDLRGQPNFSTLCPPDGSASGGFLDPGDDQLNIRFFHMKQRFGVDPELPVQRYVDGLTNPVVPDSAHEHDAAGNYAPTADCTNPLFAASLPSDASGDLCHLPAGPRVASQVFFAVIGGVPHQLLQANAGDPNSPQKAALSAADWTAILGNDPLRYDFAGADPHMLESVGPRAQSPCGVSAADDCDPISGREWDAMKQEVQFACVFDLPAPRDCNQPEYEGACDCATGSTSRDTPLCEKKPGDPNADQAGYTNTQVKGAAYPSIRALSVARGLAARAVVSSTCPIHTAESAPGDPLYAYRPALQGLVDRLGTTLQK